MLSNGVIPVERPAVPKAEVVSNNTSINSKSLFNKTTKVAVKIISNASIKIQIDLNTVLYDILFLMTCISSLPRINETAARISIAMVVTFIPPAVEPGAPPITIKIISKNFVAGFNAEFSRQLNPAVLVVTEVKKELTTPFARFMLLRVLLYSKAYIKRLWIN